MPAWPDAPPAAGDGVSGVLDWRVEGDDLVVTTNARQSDGPTPGARAILAGLGIDDGQALLVPVLREAVRLGTPRAVAPA